MGTEGSGQDAPRFAEDVTIIVPTRDRSSFVASFLDALSATGFGGAVIFCDASNPEHFGATDEKIRNQSSTFQTIHLDCDGQGVASSIASGLARVTSEFTIFLPDDDIPVPRTLDECARHLRDHDSVSAVGGDVLMISVESGRLMTSALYYLRDIVGESSRARLLDLMSDYCVVHYTVSRTAEFKARWTEVMRVTDEYMSVEVLFNALHVLDGQVRFLDSLCVVRQNHDGRRVGRNLVIDRMSSDAWSSSAETFRSVVAEVLSSKMSSGDDAETPASTANEAYWSYVLCILSRRTDRPLGLRSRRIGRIAQRVDLLLHRVCGRLKARERGARVPNLTTPKSRYHGDFMPIYDAIIANQRELSA